MLPLLSLFATTAVTAHAGDVDFDAVVYGSTPGRIAAATAAGRLGMSVGLYEPLPMIGGMGAAGALGLHDGAGIGEGLALEWQMLNAKAYNVKTPMLQPESFVGEASFRTMLANASVTTIKVNCPVTAATTAKGADGVSASGHHFDGVRAQARERHSVYRRVVRRGCDGCRRGRQLPPAARPTRHTTRATPGRACLGGWA